MGYAERCGDYFRARYKIEPGRYGTVCDPSGATIKFRTRRDAEKAANDEEAKVRASTWRDPSAGQIKFGAYASPWYAAQDLAASTMQNYRRHLEEHLLTEFENRVLAEFSAPMSTSGHVRRGSVASHNPASRRGEARCTWCWPMWSTST